MLGAACGTPHRAQSADAPLAVDASPPQQECDPSSPEACAGNTIVRCLPDGTLGGVVTDCGSAMTCANAACVAACTADGVDLIYLVTSDLQFLSFDPRKLPGDPFTLIGTLACPVTGTNLMSQGAPVEPFSMAVDQDGVAWVEYDSGEVFNVSLTTAACTATPYVPEASGMDLFGMGYVSDVPGAGAEKLFLVGGSTDAAPGGNLAVVDTHAGQYTPTILGEIFELSDVNAELTGTNAARLFGLFPRIRTPSYVQEIDKTSGAAVGSAVNISDTGLGTGALAWAFAQWGGEFYVFLTTDDGMGSGVSSVTVVDPATGTHDVPLNMTGYEVVGAGVSTCAPSVQ
jgi:hypothetical protein